MEQVDAKNDGDDHTKERNAHQTEVLDEFHPIAKRYRAKERGNPDHQGCKEEDRVENSVADGLAGRVEGDRKHLHGCAIWSIPRRTTAMISARPAACPV